MVDDASVVIGNVVMCGKAMADLGTAAAKFTADRNNGEFFHVNYILSAIK